MTNIAHHHWTKTRLASTRLRSPGKHWQKLFDHLFLIGAIFGPLTVLPQVIKIWIAKDATGVSLTTWAAACLGAMFWLLYGLVHKQKPIILSNILLILFTLIIVLEALIYSKQFIP